MRTLLTILFFLSLLAAAVWVIADGGSIQL